MADKKHILVVEDERHLAVMIKYNLEHEGYRVTTMGDGPTAVKFMDEQASEKVEPTKREQQRNREREVMGFNIGLWAMVAIVAIVIVVVALFLI